MRLEAVYFRGQFTERHAAMANVLRLSATENSPTTPLSITEITEPDDELKAIGPGKLNAQWLDNARKAKHHNEIIQAAEDGEVLGMLDTDTMVLGDLSEIESMDFDLAYTIRPPGSSKWKLNTGVYFVRVNGNVRRFVGRWYQAVLDMLADPILHHHWKKTRGYGGIHQAALGFLLESSYYMPVKLLQLPCETWNCCSKLWDKTDNPKIVHIMGQMREWCLGGRPAPTEAERRLVERWKAYDERSKSPNSMGIPENLVVDGNYNFASGKLDADAWAKGIR